MIKLILITNFKENSKALEVIHLEADQEVVVVAVVDREDHQVEVYLIREVLQGVLMKQLQDFLTLLIDTFVQHTLIFQFIMEPMVIICWC
jgi:gluconate kinase